MQNIPAENKVPKPAEAIAEIKPVDKVDKKKEEVPAVIVDSSKSYLDALIKYSAEFDTDEPIKPRINNFAGARSDPD